jgi:hypothetical protein
MATNQNGKSESKRRLADDFDDVFDQSLVSTDLPPGQYPARLAGITPVFYVRSQFDKSGEAPRFNFLFAVLNPQTGSVIILPSKLLAPPSRQASGGGVHSKSNLYKILKPLANDDAALWDPRPDTIRNGATIRQFLGRTANVIVERDEEFTRIVDVVVAPMGTTFPSSEESEHAMAAFEATQEERATRTVAPQHSEDNEPPIDDDDSDTRVSA